VHAFYPRVHGRKAVRSYPSVALVLALFSLLAVVALAEAEEVQDAVRAAQAEGPLEALGGAFEPELGRTLVLSRGASVGVARSRVFDVRVRVRNEA